MRAVLHGLVAECVRALAVLPFTASRATFSRSAFFDGASFSERAVFDRATFRMRGGFDEVTFGGSAVFYRASFLGPAGFEKAVFRGSARFDKVTFGGAYLVRGICLGQDDPVGRGEVSPGLPIGLASGVP